MSGTNLSATTSMAQNIPGMPQAQPGVAQVIFKIIQINSNPKQYLWIKLQRILGLATNELQLESSEFRIIKEERAAKKDVEKKMIREKEKIEKLQDASVDIELCETETSMILIMYI